MASTGDQPDGYRPHLDGIRALAVLAVLVQHITRTTSLYLGAAGVGLFFALSGYLITGLLLNEHERHHRISLGAFYQRRLARLAPGLLLMVAVGVVLITAAGATQYVSGAFPTLFYAMNYSAIIHGQEHLNYAFGHTWSLAVEEHFYLAWPLLLGFLLRRFSLRRVLYVTLAVCGFSLAWRFGLAELLHPQSNFFYVDTISRADALLYGCAAAIAVRLGWRPSIVQGLVGVALFVAYVSLVPVLTGDVLGSLACGLGSALLVAYLDLGRCPTLRHLLARKTLKFFGTRSYGIYLWQGPMMCAIVFGFGDSLAWRALAAVLTLWVATVAYRWVEVPARDALRPRTAVSERQPRFRAVTVKL